MMNFITIMLAVYGALIGVAVTTFVLCTNEWFIRTTTKRLMEAMQNTFEDMVD